LIHPDSNGIPELRGGTAGAESAFGDTLVVVVIG
jgi:hypothetical protein